MVDREFLMIRQFNFLEKKNICSKNDFKKLKKFDISSISLLKNDKLPENWMRPIGGVIISKKKRLNCNSMLHGNNLKFYVVTMVGFVVLILQTTFLLLVVLIEQLKYGIWQVVI